MDEEIKPQDTQEPQAPKRRGRPPRSQQVDHTPHIPTPGRPFHPPRSKKDIKDYLLRLIDDRPIESVFTSPTEVMYMSKIPTLTPESEIWKQLATDQDLIFHIQRRLIERKMDLRSTCEALGRKGNDKMMAMALKLLASEEELARIGGGGIKLEDVKKLGQDNRQQIQIVMGGSTSTKQLTDDDNSEKGQPTKRKALKISRANDIEDAVIIE